MGYLGQCGTIRTVWDSQYSEGQSVQCGTVRTVCESKESVGQSVQFGLFSTVWDSLYILIKITCNIVLPLLTLY